MTIARALCLVFAVTGCASSPSVLVALRGEWKGALEYKDYQRPDRRVTLPTDLVATAEGEASVLSFTYDDGPGKTVRGQQRLAFEEGGQVLRWATPRNRSLSTNAFGSSSAPPRPWSPRPTVKTTTGPPCCARPSPSVLIS